MELIVIRHGRTEHNIGKEKFAGNQIDNKLTKAGIEDAEILATHLKKMGKFDLVMTSRLKRSRQTARIISYRLGIPFKIIDGLEEVDIGKFAGHTEKEVKKIYPQEAKAFYRGEIEKWNFPGGEDFQEIVARIKKSIHTIIGLHKKRIILSGHGMFNRVLFYLFLKNQQQLWQERSYPHDRIVKIIIN